MPLAAFTFADALITVLEIGFLFLWIWIAIGVIVDVFRSDDLSNGAKALWLVVVFLLPLIGVLAYLIARGHRLHERHTAFQHRVRWRGSAGPADDLDKLADLRDRGILTDEEFERAKAKVLA
jgi:hypothetical protein